MQLAGDGVFGAAPDRDEALRVLRTAVDSGVNHRVRRLRVPILAAGVPRDPAGRTPVRREHAVRVPAFPLTGIHPHALAAAAAAEAGALQDRFWDMHELLFHRQQALEGSDLRGYAA
jgi:hypothetical protein